MREILDIAHDTRPEELEAAGTRDVESAIDLARRCLDAGAYLIMMESEGITEEVATWRTDVVTAIVRELGLEQVMFEAADPESSRGTCRTTAPR